ncbi:MAG TPA: lytic transglycosylase domain-containing protein [Daejeonella sp.]
MLKKHLIMCSAILVISLTAKMFIYSAPASITSLINISSESQKAEKPVDSYFNSLSFADEFLPLGDSRIVTKMNRTLHAHSRAKLQTSRLHNQASKWFPIIEPILAKYGIPEDFKYMPLVESGLKAGVSPKGAAGFWQFMPETARGFGLKVNSSVDERKNIHKSTIAAAKYIKSLYREFNSWTLAAAAYNIGEGRLKRHINHQNQDNYFKMKLNRETASYVYKLISMKEIIENPTRYGYTSKVSKLLAKNNATTHNTFPYGAPVNSEIGNKGVLIN